jgi:hypothetical protein
MKYKPWRGKEYTIDREPLFGFCDDGSREITIVPKLPRLDLIDTAIHEVLHAEFPEVKHKKVYHVATELARVIDELLEQDGHFKKGSESEGHELNADATADRSGVHGDGKGAGTAPEQGSEYEGWSVDRQLRPSAVDDGVQRVPTRNDRDS